MFSFGLSFDHAELRPVIKVSRTCGMYDKNKPSNEEQTTAKSMALTEDTDRMGSVGRSTLLLKYQFYNVNKYIPRKVKVLFHDPGSFRLVVPNQGVRPLQTFTRQF